MFAYVANAELDPPGNGITAYRLDPGSGRMDFIEHVSTASPSFIAVSPSRRTLYVITRSSGDEAGPDDAIIAFSIDPATGRLAWLNQAPISIYPTYISLDHEEKFALFVSTFSGEVGSAPLLADGRVGTPQLLKLDGLSLIEQGFGRSSIHQTKWPYGKTLFPHSIRVSPDNRFALVPDVGLNRVRVFHLDPQSGALTPNDPPSTQSVPMPEPWMSEISNIWDNPTGAGPRHMEFHPNGRWVYVVHEAGFVVAVFDYDAEKGRLTLKQDIPTLPADFKGSNAPADIHVHPSGRFVYASNRRHDSIVRYAVDPHDGRLSLLGHTPCGGNNPRNFLITPDGKLMLVGNMSSNAVVVFAIDPATGSLTPNGAVNDTPSPAHTALFVP